MTWQENIKQGQRRFEDATDAFLSELENPSADVPALMATFQEASFAYTRALREASHQTHSEAGEHFERLARDIEAGRRFFILALCGYRSRHQSAF